MRRSISLISLLSVIALLAFSSWLPAYRSASAGQGKGGEVIAKPTPTPTPKKTTTARPKTGSRTPRSNTGADELAFWETIKNSTDPEDFKAYLEQYPKGKFASLAKNRLKTLDAAKSSTNPTPTNPSSANPGSTNPSPTKPTTAPVESGSAKPAPKPGTVAKNQMGMELVYVPPGSFMMGSVNGLADERPVHRVTLMVTEATRQQAASADIELETTERELKRAKELLHANVLSQSDYDQAQIRYNEAKAKRAAIRTDEGFYMGKYEVTQAQWQSVMGNNPSHFKDCANCPVEEVSWDDAQNFMNKLNASNDGFRYRLPTEAEWEYACRAGTTGDYAGTLSEMAWYSENSGSKTHAVGGKQPNAWGLADMHGNVWEWCQDWYHETYYGAPTDGSAWLSGGDQKYRVLRGGGWSSVAAALQSAARGRTTPDDRTRYDTGGFRVVAVR